MSAVAVLDVPLLRGTTTGSEGSKGLTRRYARSRARRGPSQPPLDFRIPDTRCAPARASIGCGPRLRAIRPRAQAASITPQSHRHLALRRPLCAYPGRIRSTGRVHTRKRLFSLSRFFVTAPGGRPRTSELRMHARWSSSGTVRRWRSTLPPAWGRRTRLCTDGYLCQIRLIGCGERDFSVALGFHTTIRQRVSHDGRIVVRRQ